MSAEIHRKEKAKQWHDVSCDDVLWKSSEVKSKGIEEGMKIKA